MADRSQYLQEMVNLVGRLVEDGFSEDEIREMLVAAITHVAWSEYQWALMVRAPCRRCGKPW